MRFKCNIERVQKKLVCEQKYVVGYQWAKKTKQNKIKDLVLKRRMSCLLAKDSPYEECLEQVKILNRNKKDQNNIRNSTIIDKKETIEEFAVE
jgi:hypothetical protein